jgi:transglutaminase-like putative cysteine protease
VLLLALRVAAAPPGERTRHFEILYSATIADLPRTAKSLRVWLPYPQSDPWQTIGTVSVEAPYPHTVKHEREYGNGILYLEGPPPANGGTTVTMRFEVERREYVNRPDGPHADVRSNHEAPHLIARFRQPDRLVPLDGKIAEAAREATRGCGNDREKARAIYDYVTSRLKYDKSGSGWGRGDAVWTCDAKRGNCTDYHSLLIGMARAVGIPAKFEIGLPLPEQQSVGPIGGYHCWAAFYLDGLGWVPVDSSEASKFPARREYFFGALDENRVRLTVGRDIELDPRQGGERLNYFVYPYVEVDGAPFGGVTSAFTFRDLDWATDPHQRATPAPLP